MANSEVPFTEDLSNKALKEQYKKLTFTQKTAILLLLVGETEAAGVIRHLSRKEVQHLGAAMVAMSDVSRELMDMVLDEFVANIRQETGLSVGTSSYVEKMLVQALGEEKANRVINRIAPSPASRGLDILNWMDSRSIAELIGGEHPQIMAIIVSFLEHELAADVLHHLPEEIRPDIIMRIAKLEIIQPEALAELETIIEKQFSSNSALSSSNVGGVSQAAEIMNYTKSDMETKIMANLTIRDEDVATRIQDKMFVFDDLVGVDNSGMQILIRNIESSDLMIALKGANTEVKDRFIDNMSKRAATIFVEDMDAKGPVRVSEVEQMQKSILQIAHRLSDAGEIMLRGSSKEFV